MKRTACLRLIFLVLFVLSSEIYADYKIQLYDVDFETPIHNVGEPPNIAYGIAPRSTPTLIPGIWQGFEPPIVVSSVGSLSDQPIKFSSSSGRYCQLKFHIAGNEGFSQIFGKYVIEADILIQSLDVDFWVFVDTPTTRKIGFEPDGDIGIYVWDGAQERIGSFAFGVPLALRTEIDFVNSLWTIIINGNTIYSGVISAERLENLRFSLKGKGSLAAVDNIKIFGLSDVPILMLQHPDGNNGLYAYQEYMIRWESSEGINNVNIEYSTDRGSNWIETNPTNAGNNEHYLWQVPNVSSEDCLIRISDRDGVASDESTLTFTIYKSMGSPRTITFDPAVNPGSNETIYHWIEKGMFLSPQQFMYNIGHSWGPYNGTARHSTLGGKQVLTSVDGQPFRLINVDLAEYSEFVNSPRIITFNGYKTDSTMVTQSFTTDGIIDGPDGEDDFQTFNFSKNFRDLEYVEIPTTTYCMDNLVVAFMTENLAPVADAGHDQTVYACADGMAVVKLDGSGSYDADGDELDYFWFEGVEQIATGVDPNVQLSVGQHIIELIVNDGSEDSEPNSVVITVIGPVEADVYIVPRVINRNNRMKRVMAIIRLPEGIGRRDISDEPFVIEPGGVEASWQRIIGGGRVFAMFDKEEVMGAVEGLGRVELTVIGKLASGQCLSGTDTVRIVQPRRRRLRWRGRH